jgi:hypothetical protein
MTRTAIARGIAPTRADLDDELDGALTRRIDADPRLRGHGFGVDVYQGVALLSGEARSDEERRLAEETAAATPGVRAVATRLDVAGVPHTPYPVVVLPHVGSMVASSAGPIGRLRRVVMDARVGRATHLLVELRPGGTGTGERDGDLILIPVEAVRLVTDVLVRVRLAPAEVAALPAFIEGAVGDER